MVVPPPAPVVSVLTRFARSHGIAGRSLHDVAREAEQRVEHGFAPGRVDITVSPPRIVNYSSSLEAALDFKRQALERRREEAEDRLRAVLDDVIDGSDDETIGAAEALVDRLRAQEREATLFAPIGERVALGWALAEAQAELVTLDRPPDRELLALDAFSDKPPGIQAVQNREDNAHDHLRFAARRAVARQNAYSQGRPTPYGMTCGEIARLQGCIAEWEARHPGLAAALRAEWARGE